MLFQLSTAGRTHLNTNGLLTVVTKVEFGNAYNYVPSNNPSGLTGTKVYESTLTFSPVSVNSNQMRFTTFLPKNVGPFTFGEVAIWAGSTLLGVGSNTVELTKVNDQDGADWRVDIYVDLLASQRFASWEVVSAFTRNFFPRLQSVDLLFPPAFETNNAYVVYGDGDYNSAFLAFSDMSGQWAFSGKPKTYFTGTIASVTSTQLTSSALAAATYNGNPNELLVQFIDGAQKGYCRRLSTLVADTPNGTITWSTAMGTPPEVGDSFVILGPSVGSNFNGQHASLGSLQGGSTNERYHLTQAEANRVVNPQFKTVKTVSTTPYAILDTDNDAYITLKDQASFTVNLNDAAFAIFPVGGTVMFRYINTDVTITSGGTTTIDPFNTINIPGPDSGTFALVKRAVGLWDYIATVAEEETFDGNVRHKYPSESGTNSISTFVPMYSSTGDSNGPVTDITSSKLSLTPFGGLRMWSGALDTEPVWNSPATILIGISGNPSGSTSTGLANDATSYSVVGTINTIPFTINILGANAQTYTQLLSEFNTQLFADIGSSTMANLSINGYGLLLSTNAGGATQSIVLTAYGLFSALSNSVKAFRVSNTGTTGAVSDMAMYLNYYDSATNNNRLFRCAFGGIVIGLQNSASGQSGYSVGGAYNFSAGNYSGILGGTTNRINGFYCSIHSGYGNVIWVPPTVNSLLIPKFSSIRNSDRSIIETKASATVEADVPLFNLIDSSSNAKATGNYGAILTSKNITYTGVFGTVLGSQNSTVNGSGNTLLGSNNVTLTGTNISVQSSETVGALSGSYVSVDSVVNLPATAQSSIKYLPNGTNTGSGKPALTFQITTGAYGAGPALALTTDGGGLTTTNRMSVPTGEAWIIDAQVIVNWSIGYKAWKVRAGLKNIAGNVSVHYMEAQEIGNINGANMSVSLLVGTSGDANKVHFAVNSRNDTNTADQTVSAAAVATIVAARAL